MNIDAITVCVDYAKYLKLTINNKDIFDSWTIVTVDRDLDTIQLCKDNDLDYFISDRLYEDGDFCKGKAINDCILNNKPSDWICVVDADTYLFETLKQLLVNLDINNLYGLYGRILVKDHQELLIKLRNEFNIDEIENTGMLVGFFQLWHSSIRPFYPEESTHAGLDDILMRDSFPQERQKFLPAYCMHIGDLWINHKGVCPVSVTHSTKTS